MATPSGNPNTLLTFDVIKNLVTFITNYAEEHAILLPGRIPGYKKLLPSSTTKKVEHHDLNILTCKHSHTDTYAPNLTTSHVNVCRKCVYVHVTNNRVYTYVPYNLYCTCVVMGDMSCGVH